MTTPDYDSYYRQVWRDDLRQAHQLTPELGLWADTASVVVLPARSVESYAHRCEAAVVVATVRRWMSVADGPAWRLSKPWPPSWRVEPGWTACWVCDGSANCECGDCGAQHGCGNCEATGRTFERPAPVYALPWKTIRSLPAVKEWAERQGTELGWNGRKVWLAGRYLRRPLTMRLLAKPHGRPPGAAPLLALWGASGGFAAVMPAIKILNPMCWYGREPRRLA